MGEFKLNVLPLLLVVDGDAITTQFDCQFDCSNNPEMYRLLDNISDYFKFKYNDWKHPLKKLDHIAMVEFIDDLVCLIHLFIFDKM